MGQNDVGSTDRFRSVVLPNEDEMVEIVQCTTVCVKLDLL